MLWINGVTGFCSLTVSGQFLRKCKQITCILLLYHPSSTVKANRKNDGGKKRKPAPVVASVSLFKPYNLVDLYKPYSLQTCNSNALEHTSGRPCSLLL